MANVIGDVSGEEVKIMTMPASSFMTTTEVENANPDLQRQQTQTVETTISIQPDFDILNDNNAASSFDIMPKNKALNGAIHDSSPSLVDLDLPPTSFEAEVDTQQQHHQLEIDPFGLMNHIVSNTPTHENQRHFSAQHEMIDVIDASPQTQIQQSQATFDPTIASSPDFVNHESAIASELGPQIVKQSDNTAQLEQEQDTPRGPNTVHDILSTSPSSQEELFNKAEIPSQIPAQIKNQIDKTAQVEQEQASQGGQTTISTPPSSSQEQELKPVNNVAPIQDTPLPLTSSIPLEQATLNGDVHEAEDKRDKGNDSDAEETSTKQESLVVESFARTVDPTAASSFQSQFQSGTTNDLQDDGGPRVYASKIEYLEVELAKAQSVIEELQTKNNTGNEENGNSSLLVEIQMELQTKLQAEMNRAAEAEAKARSATKKWKELEIANQRHEEEIRQMSTLQVNLQTQTNARADAEKSAKQARERVTELERETALQKLEIQEYEKQLVKIRDKMAAIRKESAHLREAQEEHQRLEMAANTRLDLAKKREAEKAELAGKYEDLMISALKEKEEAKAELQQTQTLKQHLEQELHDAQVTSRAQILRLEKLLEEEKKLNEERKQKMKLFIDSKAEELRQAKEDNESVQIELAQTNRSLVDFNTRYQQLHNQWVQAQTRNRELQRDLNRIKKDSENLHKFGDTLEMKLSRSATETEEHKNKRLAAKQELMTVLKALDSERQVTSKLKDSLKFKFTPKALSHFQSLNDSVDALERQLIKLAARLGKPPPPISSLSDESCNRTFDFSMTNGDGNHASSSGESDAVFHIAKLEYETQRVSDAVQKITDSIDRMRQLVDASGDRTCYTVLTELITPQGLLFARSASAPIAHEGDDTVRQGAQPIRRIGLSSHRYGQVPSEHDH